MIIKVTEIEASAEELRQSNSISDGLTRMIRNAFNPIGFVAAEDEEADDEQ